MRNNDIESIKESLNTEIERVKQEETKQREKEIAIQNKKDEMLNQFENSENKEILNRILNKENITEEYLNCLQEMLKENPSNTVYIFFEQYVEKNTDFNSLTVQGKYIDWLKTADVRTNNITDSWKSLLNLIDNTPITEDYLKGLKHANERPLFNDLGLKDILEFSKKIRQWQKLSLIHI